VLLDATGDRRSKVFRARQEITCTVGCQMMVGCRRPSAGAQLCKLFPDGPLGRPRLILNNVTVRWRRSLTTLGSLKLRTNGFRCALQP